MNFKGINFDFLKKRLIWKQAVPGCDVSFRINVTQNMLTQKYNFC